MTNNNSNTPKEAYKRNLVGLSNKKHGNARDYSQSVSRANDEKLLSNSVNSVHDFSGNKKGQHGIDMHELSM